MKYVIVKDSISDFSKFVELALNDGWLLYGPPFNDAYVLYQGLIKPENEEDYDKLVRYYK